MDSLLKNDFIVYLEAQLAYLGENAPVVVPVDTIRMEIIADSDFDIKDREAVIKQPVGRGSVTYRNPANKEIAVIDYENFLDAQSENVIKKLELKKPDFIVYDKKTKTHFIINELSQGDPNNKRNDAKIQMHNAAFHFSKVPNIQRFLDGFQKKLCVFSARKPPSTPEGMADAFFMNNDFIPEPIVLKFQPISKLGYELIETSLINFF